MDKLRQHFRSAATTARVLRRSARRMLRGSRLGIAARLSIAFLAVAILAVAANQIAERGNTLLSAIAATPVVSAGLDERTAELLPAALDHYQRAVLARTESSAQMRTAALADSTAALEDAREVFAAAVQPDVSAAVLSGLADEVAAYAELGAQSVRSADARRRLLNELDIEFQSLDVRSHHNHLEPVTFEQTLHRFTREIVQVH